MAKRRGNQEGTIYQRKDGRWCAQVTLDGKRLTKYANTQRECREWIKKITSQIGHGLSYEATRTTLSQFMPQWLEAVESSVKPMTFLQYKQVTIQHILPSLGTRKMKDLRPDEIQALYSHKISEGKTPSTVRIIHAVLHRALSQAVNWGFILRNPADLVEKPRVKKKEIRVLTSQEALSLLNVAHGSKYALIYHLALTTGLRKGEILGLKWADLDWSDGSLRVQRQLLRVTGKGLMFSQPKSEKSRRLIYIGPSTLEKLRVHKKHQELVKAFAGNRWQETGLIFTSSIGTPIEPRNLVRVFKKVLAEAGLPNIRFHDLRHTAATWMLQEGIHPKVVQEMLGHSQISVTLDTYSHVLPVIQEEAALKLDELLTPVQIEF